MNEDMFNELLKSVEQMDDIVAGRASPSRAFEFPDPDVAGIRKRTRLSQEKFGRLIGVKVSTLRNWEQGRRRPTGPARTLFRVMEKNPMAVIEALNGGD